jgi:hypothetical protein
MGQRNNSGRNASLDQHKERAAGRQKDLGGRHELNRDDFNAGPASKGSVGGATGSEKSNEPVEPSNLSKGAGGGGASEQGAQ